ncbi:MAG: hypothetical protein ACE5IM_06300, partial [Nitrospinota bacterium]
MGRDLVHMLESLRHRGADSTGVTVLGETFQGDLILRLHAPEAAGETNGRPAGAWLDGTVAAVEGA